jgi:hypothetical protein
MKKVKKSKKSSKKSKLFLSLICLFVALFLVFLFFQLDISLDFKKEIKNFYIEDSCGPSPVGGTVLHQVNNDAECKLKCSNLCSVWELKYYSHEFISENRTCYLCDCNCK